MVVLEQISQYEFAFVLLTGAISTGSQGNEKGSLEANHRSELLSPSNLTVWNTSPSSAHSTNRLPPTLMSMYPHCVLRLIKSFIIISGCGIVWMELLFHGWKVWWYLVRDRQIDRISVSEFLFGWWNIQFQWRSPFLKLNQRCFWHK